MTDGPIVVGSKAPREGEPRDVAVVWQPQPKQAAAVACPVKEVFYGGARGGGKSDFLLGDYAVHAQKYPGKTTGVIFRRTLTELEELERRAVEIFGVAGLGWAYRAQKHDFTSPEGDRLVLRYLDRDEDAEQYQGWNVTWVGVDEVGNFPSPTPIDKIRATLRSVHGVPTFIRLTGNPGGPGHHWIRERWVNPHPQGMRPFRYRPQPELRPDLWIEAVFIPARLEDNPLLLEADPTYEEQLAAAGGPELYRAWRFGDWDALVGQVFREWRADLHVLQQFEVPPRWRLAGGLDWGFRAPACFLLFAVGPDGDVVALDELYFRETHGFDAGRAIGLMCRKHGWVEYIAGDEQMWYQTGQSAPTIAEEVQAGIVSVFGEDGRQNAPVLIEATHGRGSRWAKKMLTHRYLSWKEVLNQQTGEREIPPWHRPMLRFTVRCKETIRTLPALPYDPDKPEDVDTDAEDHAYDALGAFLMSRVPKGEEQGSEVPPERHPGYDHGRRQRRPRYIDRLERIMQGQDGEEDESSGLQPYRGGVI